VLKRFEREAKALAQLSHPNIVHVHDYGEYEGAPYLVMEYLPGGVLKSKLGTAMPWREAVRLLLPIAQALAYAHEHNIVHRDVKPSNILLTEKGQPMLSDFGIAKILESEQTTGLTTTGMGVGTPEYMAPEQWTGQAGTLSDLYSLGVVLYELVTGRKPYTADTPAAIMLKQANDPLPRPRQFVPDLPDGVEKVLFKALAKTPDDRYQSMGEFTAALENLMSGHTLPEGVPPEQTKPAQEATLPAGGSGRQAPQAEPKVSAPPRRSLKLGKTGGWAAVIGVLVLACLLLVALGFGLVKLAQQGRGPLAGLLGSGVTPTPALTHPETLPPPEIPTPRDTSVPSESDSIISPRDGMKSVQVPAGQFLMGVTKADLDTLYYMCPECKPGIFEDAPQHSIYLDGFRIDETEVTTSQFALFIQETGYRTDAEKQGSSLVFDSAINDYNRVKAVDWRHPQGRQVNLEQYGLYPVVQVSWNDAKAYCAWAGRRLPTEAEWEKAARGTQGFFFPWGNTPPNNQFVNFNRTRGSADPVGSYPDGASPYGALDMAGNVWEWTSSYYGETYYNQMPDRNPPGPSTGAERVLKGGSWAATEKKELILLSSAFRLDYAETFNSDLVGFRCAQDLIPSTQTSTPSAGSTWVRPVDGLTMVYIPEGFFRMGQTAEQAVAECRNFFNDCQLGWFSDEQPPHDVTLDGYWIDRAEVTNAVYAKCVDAGACQPPSDTSSATRNSYYGNPQYAGYPVINVDWSQAYHYCTWAGGRLPSEAEWEKAARSMDWRTYPWGNNLPSCSLANYGEPQNCSGDTSPSDGYASGASPYGAINMAGNVSEWVNDWYSEAIYAQPQVSNPTGPETGTERVLRGGAWNLNPNFLRTSNRDHQSPVTRSNSIGFRCAMSVQ
jgi:formylglycine-generating enzyme required for sulfatase activity